MKDKLLGYVSKACLEVYFMIKYNTLKLKKEIEIRNLEKYTNELIQQLADVKVDLNTTKTRLSVSEKYIKDLKKVIRENDKESRGK